MDRRRTAAGALAVALLAALAVSAVAETVVDGFEADTLGAAWNPRFVTPGRVMVQREVVRTGVAALRIEVREGDVPMVGVDGAETERTEVQEARPSRFGETHEYAFSMHVPADFPILDNRLVTAQWHQRCVVCLKRSPVVAQRYRRGVLSITIDSAAGRTTAYRHAESIRGRWVDFRYRIRFGLTDGAVAVWLDGVQVVDYKGPLGYPDDGPDVDFRFGLYRDRVATPMFVYFDDFRKERLAE
jgi:hypothetical protein